MRVIVVELTIMGICRESKKYRVALMKSLLIIAQVKRREQIQVGKSSGPGVFDLAIFSRVSCKSILLKGLIK